MIKLAIKLLCLYFLIPLPITGDVDDTPTSSIAIFTYSRAVSTEISITPSIGLQMSERPPD